MDINKKRMLEALENAKGIVTTACKMANVPRSTHYTWMEKDPEYVKAVQDVQDIALDFVESKLLESIDNGEVTAQIFYLKTKGKHRGYVERQEVTGADGKDLMPTIDVSKMTTEELREYLRRKRSK